VKPVLFLIFNRPDLTRKSFSAIRRYQPKHLFVAADGPRSSKEGEALASEETRKIVTENIDWDCEVQTLFRDQNLGCQKAVSSGISWFFENVDEGIILEDDCLPDPSFFEFCDELLEKYRNNKSIGTISGDNFQHGISRGASSYYFSKFFHCWGWATWKDRWALYESNLYQDPDEIRKVVANFPLVFGEHKHWESTFRRTNENEIDTWDYRFLYACWKNKLLSVLPQVNLVENIGFTSDATHTTGSRPSYAGDGDAIQFPLVHPDKISQNVEADYFSARKNINLTLTRPLKDAIRKLQSLIVGNK